MAGPANPPSSELIADYVGAVNEALDNFPIRNPGDIRLTVDALRSIIENRELGPSIPEGNTNLRSRVISLYTN